MNNLKNLNIKSYLNNNNKLINKIMFNIRFNKNNNKKHKNNLNKKFNLNKRLMINKICNNYNKLNLNNNHKIK